MRYLITTFLLLTLQVHAVQLEDLNSFAENSSQVSTTEHIMRCNPGIGIVYATIIGSLIDKYSAEYDVPRLVVSSIFMLESAYKVSAFNSKTKDYGIGQVSEYHIKKSKLDRRRLLYDLDYSVKWAVHIYAWFHKTYPVEESIARYNCGTKKSCIKDKKVVKYLKLVKRYLNRGNA